MELSRRPKKTKARRNARSLSPAESIAFYLWIEIALKRKSVDFEKLLSMMPGGSGARHAHAIRKVVSEAGWILFGAGHADQLAFEYGKSLITTHVLPILRRRFAPDEEAMEWIMMPELSVRFEESGYTARYPENSFRLWQHVDRYFHSRFTCYPKGRAAVASVFFFSHCGYLDAVEHISSALVEEESTDFMRKGSFGRILQNVKALEARTLVNSFATCCSLPAH